MGPVVELPLRVGEVLVAVQERSDVGVVAMPDPVGDVRVGPQHDVQALAGIAHRVTGLGELCQVRGDLAVVPGVQDGLDVGEALVQGGAADAWPAQRSARAGSVVWQPSGQDLMILVVGSGADGCCGGAAGGG